MSAAPQALDGPGPVDLSAIICTRDRAGELTRTLDGLTRARVPAGLRWELVVVDNGSADGTSGVADGFRDRLPVRVIREPRPGLSIARNRAVEEARGAALLWTDDDVTVGPDWLEGHVEALAAHPGHGFFGGPIRAVFEGGTPAWAVAAWPEVERYYAAREPPIGADVSPEYVPYGANFAIRRDVQRRYRYDPGLGRRPGDLRSGEEWDVIQRALADGVRGRWIGAAVDHRISPERATPGHVCAVARAIGRTGAGALDPGDGPRWRGRPLWLWREFAGLGFRLAAARIAGDPARWVPLALERARVGGLLEGLGGSSGSSGARSTGGTRRGGP